MNDLIIIGGGPAGLTAAIYAIRKRLDVMLISKDLGGKTNYRLSLPWIEDYQVIRGLEIVSKFRNELEYLEYARELDSVEKLSKIEDVFALKTKNGKEYQAKAVIVASGTRQVRLNVPGEKEYTMKGLCYSALSYAPLFIDKKVVVIGNDELALRAAGELATVARHVTLVTGNNDRLKTDLGKKLARSKNVTILENHSVVEVKGDTYARTVVTKDAAGVLQEIAADGTFVEMALTPNTQMLDGLVELDNRGRIIVDNAGKTSTPGIFAAGDVTNTYAEQVLVAIGEGAKAALSAYDYLLPTL
jgi:alkyl hydroperoxide reductase subunit F